MTLKFCFSAWNIMVIYATEFNLVKPAIMLWASLLKKKKDSTMFSPKNFAMFSILQ